jgi:hypothetical protein
MFNDLNYAVTPVDWTHLVWISFCSWRLLEARGLSSAS